MVKMKLAGRWKYDRGDRDCCWLRCVWADQSEQFWNSEGSPLRDGSWNRVFQPEGEYNAVENEKTDEH